MGSLRTPLLLTVCIGLAACSITDSDLAAFETTAMGPEKLRAVLRDTHRDASLRARAALRLLDLPRTDVDGRTLLFSDLSHLSVQGRSSIVPTFAEGLIARMQTPEGTAPGPRAVNAKDAGVELLGMLDADARAALGRVLLTFMARDLERRADVGKHNLESVTGSVGASGVSTLVEALRPQLSVSSLARLAALIDQHADRSTREFAAKCLSDVERVRAVRVDLPASEQAYVLRALGRFRDQDAARARLVEVARDGTRAEAIRLEALNLLETHVDEGELEGLLALATDLTAPVDVRLVATSRAGETRSKKALPALLTLLADRNHDDLRRRAGELILEMGVPESAPAFFRTLPSAWDMRYSKAELDAYAERLVLLPRDIPLVALLNEKLNSSFWWNRILALRYFAQKGDVSDLWRLNSHSNDAYYVNGAGFPRAYTVGQEAEAAFAIASERHHARWSLNKGLPVAEPAAANPPAPPAAANPPAAPAAANPPAAPAAVNPPAHDPASVAPAADAIPAPPILPGSALQ